MHSTRRGRGSRTLPDRLKPSRWSGASIPAATSMATPWSQPSVFLPSRVSLQSPNQSSPLTWNSNPGDDGCPPTRTEQRFSRDVRQRGLPASLDEGLIGLAGEAIIAGKADGDATVPTEQDTP